MTHLVVLVYKLDFTVLARLKNCFNPIYTTYVSFGFVREIISVLSMGKLQSFKSQFFVTRDIGDAKEVVVFL
jgi:hypothetical protein